LDFGFYNTFFIPKSFLFERPLFLVIFVDFRKEKSPAKRRRLFREGERDQIARPLFLILSILPGTIYPAPRGHGFYPPSELVLWCGIPPHGQSPEG